MTSVSRIACSGNKQRYVIDILTGRNFTVCTLSGFNGQNTPNLQ